MTRLGARMGRWVVRGGIGYIAPHSLALTHCSPFPRKQAIVPRGIASYNLYFLLPRPNSYHQRTIQSNKPVDPPPLTVPKALPIHLPTHPRTYTLQQTCPVPCRRPTGRFFTHNSVAMFIDSWSGI
jgi:hypothetical protein